MQFPITFIVLGCLAVVGSFVCIFTNPLSFIRNTTKFFGNNKCTTVSATKPPVSTLAANASTFVHVTKNDNMLSPALSSTVNPPCTSKSASENENPKKVSDSDDEYNFADDPNGVNAYYEHYQNMFNPNITSKSEPTTSASTSNVLPESTLPNNSNPPSPSPSSYEIISSQTSSSGSNSPIGVIHKSNSDSSLNTKPLTDKYNALSKNDLPVGNPLKRTVSEPILTKKPNVPLSNVTPFTTAETSSSTEDDESAEYSADDEKEEGSKIIKQRPLDRKNLISSSDKEETSDHYSDSKSYNPDDLNDRVHSYNPIDLDDSDDLNDSVDLVETVNSNNQVDNIPKKSTFKSFFSW